VDKVDPTLFILQFFVNDFVNNHLEWESKSLVKHQYLRRPFASIRSDEPRHQSGVLAWLYRSRIGDSRILNRIDGLVQNAQSRWQGDPLESLPIALRERYEAESIAVTRRLLVKLRAYYSRIPAVMVNCVGEEVGPNRSWTTLARESGFVPIEAPSIALLEAKARGDQDIFHADGAHLSDDGNQLHGSVLTEELASLKTDPGAALERPR